MRKVTFKDLEDMHSFTSSKEVTKYIPFPTHKNLEDTRKFIDYLLEQYQINKKLLWGIQLKETSKLIGTIEFVTFETAHNKAEIAYVLSEDYWGDGIMTEAAKEVIKFGFKSLNLTRIQARTFKENIGSQKVLNKIGMTYEGTLRKSMFIKGDYQDINMFSVLNEEYIRTTE
ncbi:GNAT family N-acetyltransferase [Mesobacillus maritimus]|uniref:GNAT family N-acetyltransferase n=2 Tax=Mesobacillus maritimus TaxID=1643336 RepID=A0ABS7K3M6_9BACI|nr:GNAT family N-acetyltransferase [Mesobacillus maritimus]